jgi:hypothetical protein
MTRLELSSVLIFTAIMIIYVTLIVTKNPILNCIDFGICK